MQQWREQKTYPHTLPLARLHPPKLRTLFILLILSAATIIKVANLRTVKHGLAKLLVDLIMHMAAPSGRRAARRDLRRELLENQTKVLGALAAGVQALEEVDVLP